MYERTVIIQAFFNKRLQSGRWFHVVVFGRADTGIVT